MWTIVPAKLGVMVFVLSLSQWTIPAYSDVSDDFDRRIEPVEISGHAIASLTGALIENVRVYASRDNRLLPIPFQIDQRNSSDDWVWTKIPERGNKRSEALQDNDPDIPAAGRLDLTIDDQDPQGKPTFDSNDVLVFMARDAGNRYTDAANKPGLLMVELELSDPQDGSRGWVYIVRFASNPTALAKQRYVSYQESGRRVVAPGYELVYSPKHSVMLVDLEVDGVSILERSRINGKVKAGMGPLTTTMEFDERAIDGYDAGYINGPVRVVKRSVDHVKIKAGMRSPDVNCDHYYYPWHAEVPMLFSMRFPVKGVEMLAASRYRSGVFNHATVPQTNQSISIANSQHDANLLADRTDAGWLSLHGDRLTVVGRIKIPDGIGDYFSVAPYLANDSGQAVEAGYVIKTKKGIKKGEHVLHSVFLISPDSNDNNAAAKATGLFDNKLHVEASTLQ